MYCALGRCFCRKDAVRALSTGEISTALRPFYFTVHPDLFGQYPTQRTVNENSLKQLSSIIESLQQQRPIRPTTLPFYLRSKNEKELKAGKFTLVQIQLKEKDLRQTILSILKTCDLPTTFVDQIEEQKPPDSTKYKSRYWQRKGAGEDIDFSELEDDPIYASILMKRKINSEPDALKAYLDKHINEVHVKLEACRPMREEVQKLEKILCTELGLKNIIWDCGWNIAHYRGCLLAFKALAEHHPEPMEVLKNRTLVFANDTGISVEGNVMLNSGEVRHNWLDLIKNIQKYDVVLFRLPAFEKAVSQVLLDIKVGRRVLYMCRKFMPKVMVSQYERQLRQLTTTLSDYRGRRNYPKMWPADLSTYEIVIEAEAGPLMLSPTGQFIVPSSCPSFLLVNFITDNLEEATKRLHHYNNIKYVERELHDKTVQELGLTVLNKDDSITPDLMIQCCERLLLHKSILAPLLKGVMLWVTHYYSVMSDGVLCIPWDWKL
ncbi:T-cell activation inhibitor, mitochondrial-like isoform X1 [Bombus affinis]|uniref:T-cell activation inhibitor, mitochondrial-like isoform X1 n=1 Tax=Bombus affinis TaxID=309941 RepID=UPI0021B7FC50|nr:T-cell activation inhibitor, mitochondrial-like isoform X1 [Bombus affinis]XP_050574265.1 T-cell activation inhibitor, mitochondrial-like isoform X1 [Bombus affinis]